MMVHNHFELRWIDGYGAASDAPSELAVRIEEVASNISRSLDHAHLAVRSVRLPDGDEACVGLLQLDVAVSSEQRPVAFLHAVVLPPGHRLDDDRWRALVERRYGPDPEERIREIYEELAVTTKDKGRKRLRELEIRPEDVREVIGSRASSTKFALAKKGARAGSESGARALPNSPFRPPTSPPFRPSTIPPLPMPGAAPAGPQRRPSQSAFGPSAFGPSAGDDDESADTTSGAPIIATPGGGSGSTAELAAQAAPSGSQPAVASSRTPYRGMPLVGFAVSAVAIVAAVWLAIYAREVGRERDRLAEELARPRIPVEDVAVVELRSQVEKYQRDLATAQRHIEELRTSMSNRPDQDCNKSLDEARAKLGAQAAQISTLEANLLNVRNQLATLMAKPKDDDAADVRAHLEAERDQLKRDNAQLTHEIAKHDQIVKLLCESLRGSYSSKLLQICKGVM